MKTSSGYCSIHRLSNDIPQTHIILTYEEALKLNIAIQCELIKISQMDRRAEGKYAGVDLMILPKGTPNIVVKSGSTKRVGRA